MNEEKQKCKKCGSENVVMVEYEHGHPERYDGVGEIDCRDCGARFGRWSDKELAEGEFEPRFGQSKK